MPFRNYRQFDSETLCIMQSAYSAALVRLGAASGDPRSGSIAAAIAKLTDEGERDPNVLCELALRTLNLWSSASSVTAPSNIAEC